MDQLKALWANAQNWFTSLSTRERRMVVGAGSAVVVFILFMIFSGLAGTASSTQSHIATKLSKLQDVQALAGTFREQESQRQATERQLGNNGIKLISYIEEKRTLAGLEIQSMNMKGDVPIGEGNILESAVELTLTDINIRKLVDFLNSVEVGGLVKVKALRMEPRVSNETLTAWVTVVTYKLKQ